MKEKKLFPNRFKQENGEIFHGKTYRLNNPRVHLYMLFGPNENIYWARFSSYEYLHKKSINETIRIGKFHRFGPLLFQSIFKLYVLLLSY